MALAVMTGLQAFCMICGLVKTASLPNNRAVYLVSITAPNAMKELKMKCLFIAVICAVFAAPSFTVAQPTAKGLAVHEWGVFRVSEDLGFANAAVRATWDGLPEFIYGHIKGRIVPQ